MIFNNQGRRPDEKAPAGFRPVAPRPGDRPGGIFEQARSSGGEHYLDTVGVSGSNPLEPTNLFGTKALSSAGRALPSHGRGQRFEPVSAYQSKHDAG